MGDVHDGLLTIGITSYNYGCYIEDAVKSVINQTSPHWRLIICDNCSIDNTSEILKPYLQDPRIHLVVHEKNIGAINNSIFVLNSAKTEFFSFLQADDFLDASFVENALAQFNKHPNAPFTFFDWLQYIDDSKTSFHHGRFPFSQSRSGPMRIGPYLTVCNFVPLHMVVFRTSYFQKAYPVLLASPLKQVGEQYILKLIEDEYGCGCYSGIMGGVWRRHNKQMTTENMASSLAQIEEPLERHWYASKAPNPDYVNVFLSLVTFIQLCSHQSYIASANWLINNGASYAESFGVPIEQERDRLRSIVLTVALKYSTFSSISLIDENDLKKWLKEEINCQPTFEGLKFKLESIKKREGDTFLNTEEIHEICYRFFEKESSYSTWIARHFWSQERCHRLLNRTKSHEQLPIIHIILTENIRGQGQLIQNYSDQQFTALSELLSASATSTISDLIAQALANWRLTILSEHACPDSRFESSDLMEWIQTSSQQADAMTAIIAASPAEWFICAPAGLRLSPAFTLLTGLRLSKQPDALVLYTDEDIVNADGEHSQPKLKPDINIELLRSSPYIGAATLIRKPLMLDPRIAILPLGLSRNYGAALLAFEQTPSAVDHLDEIVVHVPEALAEEYAGTALAHLLVQQHLARCGATAEICDGPLPETLFINYQLPANPPMVSIIITARQRLDKIQTCLETLLEKTNYSDFEILVIDNEKTEPAVQAFLARLPNSNSHVKILHYSQKYSVSAINNFSARQAQGEYLLLLNDDTVILQENWLARLVAIGIQKDVGVAGCRLVSFEQHIKHAGLILGHGGTVDHIGTDLPLTEPGYMGRAQLMQNFSAVSGACILVRKDLFFDAGGFDEKNFPISHYDADLCLKLGERDYRIVWTPFVTLAQQDDKPLSIEKEAKQDNQQNLTDLHSRKAFIKKWLPKLANDPAYNRHLSLRQREWMIDGDFDVPWHPDLEPLPRIVAQAPDEMGVGQYRMIGPIQELTRSHRICSFMLPALSSEKRFLPYVSELIRAKPTVFFLQNAFSDFHLDDLQHYAELLPDVFRVFGQDDIVFSIPQKSAARKYFGKDTKARVRRAVSLCHRVIVTTEPIAEAMRSMVDDIQVVPNSLERSRWGGLQPPRNDRRKPRVGWAGAQQHQGDLEFILPVVEATANEVDWIFMGLCPPKLRYHVAGVQNAVPFDQYPAALAALDLDLAIAPLEINRFNTAKSNLRLLEYGAVGFPVIATDILPYRNAPVTRVPNNPKAWIDAIRAHIHDLDATRIAGEQLREWVLSNWMLDQHLDEWMKALLPD